MTNPTRRNVLRLAATGAIALPILATTARAASHAAPKVVTISNFAFSPANIEITSGHGVTFVNQDSAPHTATADNGAFDTGRLNNGQQATLTFNAPGTYSYSCAFHPMMKGTITVT